MRHFLVAVGLACATGAEGQAPDQGTLVIKQAGRELGREEFVIRNGRAGGAQGTTITTRGRFPAVAPALTQEGVVERRSDGSFISMQVTREADPVVSRFLAEVTPRNVLRIHASTSGGAEGVREYPAVPRLIGLVENSFALYAAVVPLATPEGTTLTALFPEDGRRVAFNARKDPGEGGTGSSIVMSGEINGTIWLDPNGQILRLELPSTGLEAVRLGR